MEKLTLHSILSPAVVAVAPDVPLDDVLANMESLHISCIIAIDERHHPLGIFTEQDAIRLMAGGKRVAGLKMSDMMSSPPLTATGDMDFRDAYRLISERGFRHLIVVDESGRLTGVVSEADFLHHLGMEYLVEFKTVGAAMTTDVLTLPETATLADVVNMMARHRISCVPIARNGKPVGILTERDVVSLAREIIDPAHVSITRVMTAPVRTIHADYPLQGAVRIMEEAGIRRLVVVEGGIINGLVTRHDIVKTMQGRYIEFLHKTLDRQRHNLEQAQRQLTETRHRLLLHSLMEQVSDAVFVVDAASGSFVDVNDHACRSLQYTRAELLKLSLFDISTELERGSAWLDFLARFASNEHQVLELQQRRHDGSTFPAEINIRMLERDGHTYLIAVTRDLTDLRQAKKAMQETLGNLNALIEAFPDAIFFKDGEGRWLITNEPAKQLFNLHGFDWQGKTEMELAAARPEFKAAHEACLADDEIAWRSGKLTFFNEHIQDCSGQIYEFEVRKVPIFDENHQRKGLVVIGRDITERRRSEEQLREAAAVMQNTHEGVVITDTTPVILAVNAAYSTITGYSPEEVIGKNPSIISSGRADKAFHKAMWQSLLQDGYW